MLLPKQFITIVIINFICFNQSSAGYPRHSSLMRVKHNESAVYQFICGFGVPLSDLQYESITSGITFKTKYLLPQQTINPYKQIFRMEKGRTSRSEVYKAHTPFNALRWTVYELLAMWADKFNLGGHVCVLKSLCEAAQRKFTLQSGDVWHDIAHILFTPQTSLDQLASKSQKDFMEAALPGNQQKPNATCHTQYSACTRSVLSIFSNI